MAITVDYSTAAPWLITIPKSDLTLDTGTQYKLNVDVFWLLLADFTDNENVMSRPKLYSRIPATSSTPSITEIELDSYRLQFEDGAYSVNIIDGNTNIREAEIKNTVSVNTNNTTGFIDAAFLEFSTFEGGVWVDAINGVAGVTGLTGSPAFPSSNIPDAVAISAARGLPKTMYIIGNYTLDAGDDVSGYKIIGQNAARTSLTINTAASTMGCEILESTVTGVLDGLTIIRYCAISDMDYFSGFIYESEIQGTITLGSGAQASILGCYSGTPGVTTPTINFGGSGQALSLRKYSGGIKFENKTGPDSISVDLIGGQVRLDLTTVTNGTVVVRGSGKVVDDSNDDWLPHGTYGSLILDNEVSSGLFLQDLWTAHGLDPDVPATAGTVLDDLATDLTFVKDIEGGKWEIVGTQMIFYKDDNITEVARFNIDDVDAPKLRTRV